MLFYPPFPPTLRFRVTYNNKALGLSDVGEESDYPRYPDEVVEMSCASLVGDLFSELYRRNPPEPGYEWSFASPIDKLIYRYPCKNELPLLSVFCTPAYFNQAGEIEIVADQDHLLTEAVTIIKDYDFMISLIKRLPIPSERDQHQRVINCLAKVITGIMNRIKYRPDLPQFCYPNCIHQTEFNKLRIYANSVADGSIFGLTTPAASFGNEITTTEDTHQHKYSHKHKKPRREAFLIENLPEELIMHILSFLGPKELCAMEQVSTSWTSRASADNKMWGKFCNGWKLRDEKEEPLGCKNIVKIVYEIHSCRQQKPF